MENEVLNQILELLKKWYSEKDKSEYQDSIEIGNSKTGKFKVYVNANNKKEAEQRINTMMELTRNAFNKFNGGE